jgi:hypothetical protein
LPDTYSGVEGKFEKVYDTPDLTQRQIKANSVFERVSHLISSISYQDLLLSELIESKSETTANISPFKKYNFIYTGNSTVNSKIQGAC